MLAPPRLERDDSEAFLQRHGDRWRRRRAEYIRSRALHQPIDHIGLAGDKRAARARRFTQCAHVNNIRRMNAEVFQHAAPIRAEDAEAVRIVEQQPGIVMFA